MRTWLLAPDGIWAEVTDRVTGCDPNPDRWPWGVILDGIAGLDAVHRAHPKTLRRGDLQSVSGDYGDRWIVNLIWSTLCTDRVDALTAIRMSALSNQLWLGAVAKWSGRPDTGRPPEAWVDRRGRWMLWAHCDSATAPPLDGARVVVGAVQPTT